MLSQRACCFARIALNNININIPHSLQANVISTVSCWLCIHLTSAINTISQCLHYFCRWFIYPCISVTSSCCWICQLPRPQILNHGQKPLASLRAFGFTICLLTRSVNAFIGFVVEASSLKVWHWKIDEWTKHSPQAYLFNSLLNTIPFVMIKFRIAGFVAFFVCYNHVQTSFVTWAINP